LSKLILFLIVAALGWFAYSNYQKRAEPAQVEGQVSPVRLQSTVPNPAPLASPYKCDGRTYCSQMTSCAEATWFLKNCPGTKMDGNHDGVPCEQQWCK
jgi:Excalibur calcium-binding domain